MNVDTHSPPATHGGPETLENSRIHTAANYLLYILEIQISKVVTMKTLMRMLCVQAVLLTSLGLWAQQDQAPTAGTTNTAPDNTKVNQRDRNPSQPTADQQTNAKSDREMTRQIRRAIVKDKSLSTYAHNIKVITQNGMVTLKGPVKTEEDKQAIGSKAAEVVGSPDKVQNQIEVGSSDASAKPSPSKQ